MITRRNFLKQTAGITAGIAFHVESLKPNRSNYKDNNFEVFIPMPVQVVIDDVGWWSGEDGSKMNQPFRTGINRIHVPADYQAIVDLGKGLGIRPQAAFILCEWDKQNILRKLPSSTWMGSNWDNSKWVGPWMEEAADIIRSNQRFIELTLHGIGHEFWEGDHFTRAEWHDYNGNMRPKEEIEKHLDYFELLMKQHNLGPFPKSFVPTAFLHSFGPSSRNNVSLASILKRRGIDYINTPFGSIFNKERIKYDFWGIDDDVITVDRGRDEFSWKTYPVEPTLELKGPTCGMHWPNLLHPDPFRNSEIVKKWIDYLERINDKPHMILARDSVCFQNQLVHHTLTEKKLKGNRIEFDFSALNNLPANIRLDELTIKIKTNDQVRFKPLNISILDMKMKNTNENEIMYVMRLIREQEKLNAAIILSN